MAKRKRSTKAKKRVAKLRRKKVVRSRARRTSRPRKNASKRTGRKRVSAALRKYLEREAKHKNPSKVKGHKVKGGRSVSLKNFTGTVTRKSNGQVVIRGRGRK